MSRAGQCCFDPKMSKKFSSGEGTLPKSNVTPTLDPTFNFSGGVHCPKCYCDPKSNLQMFSTPSLRMPGLHLPPTSSSPDPDILVGGGSTLPCYIRVHCKSVRFTPDRLHKHSVRQLCQKQANYFAFPYY